MDLSKVQILGKWLVLNSVQNSMNEYNMTVNYQKSYLSVTILGTSPEVVMGMLTQGQRQQTKGQKPARHDPVPSP